MSNTEMSIEDMQSVPRNTDIICGCECRNSTSLECLMSVLRRRDTKIDQLQNDVLKLETDTESMKKKDAEINKLREENEQLKRQLAKRSSNFDTQIELMEEKLKHELNTIKTNLVNIIDNKLSSQVKQLENSTATQQSYADAARSTNTETGMTKLRTKKKRMQYWQRRWIKRIEIRTS